MVERHEIIVAFSEEVNGLVIMETIAPLVYTPLYLLLIAGEELEIWRNCLLMDGLG